MNGEVHSQCHKTLQIQGLFRCMKSVFLRCQKVSKLGRVTICSIRCKIYQVAQQQYCWDTDIYSYEKCLNVDLAHPISYDTFCIILKFPSSHFGKHALKRDMRHKTCDQNTCYWTPSLRNWVCNTWSVGERCNNREQKLQSVDHVRLLIKDIWLGYAHSKFHHIRCVCIIWRDTAKFGYMIHW